MPWLMPIKRYCQFNGRSGRAEFWQFTVFYAFAVTIGAVLDYTLQGPYCAPLLTASVFIALAVPGYAVGFRRLLDRNLSGWLLGTTMMLNGLYFTIDNLRVDIVGTPIALIYDPVADISLVLSLILVTYSFVQAALPSDPQPNRFGDRLTDTTGPGPGAADLSARGKALLRHLAKPTGVRQPAPLATLERGDGYLAGVGAGVAEAAHSASPLDGRASS